MDSKIFVKYFNKLILEQMRKNGHPPPKNLHPNMNSIEFCKQLQMSGYIYSNIVINQEAFDVDQILNQAYLMGYPPPDTGSFDLEEGECLHVDFSVNYESCDESVNFSSDEEESVNFSSDEEESVNFSSDEEESVNFSSDEFYEYLKDVELYEIHLIE